MAIERTAVSSPAPRVLLAATGSGSGKTTLTCGILKAFLSRGVGVTAFKSGPDFVDPMFHTSAVGVRSRNLDLFLCSEETVRGILCKHGGEEISIIEGVMGFYDGMGNTTRASSYHLATATQTPVILLVSCRGMSLSVAAQVLGYLRLRPDSPIAGVILNRVSPMFYPTLKEMVERECGVPVLGYLPEMPDASLESRHLGLIPAEEVQGLGEKLQRIAHQVERTVDLDAILRLGRTAPPLQGILPKGSPMGSFRVGVARDRAFCFYYQDNLDLLRELGAELVPFSPMEDKAPPQGLDGLLLGGGYPEVFAEALAKNETMRTAIRSLLEDSLPCIAECGGFMYLHQRLEGRDGVHYPMVGALPGSCFMTPRLVRFGYCTLTANSDTPYCAKGQTFPAHEFHHWDSDLAADLFTAEKPGRAGQWQAGVAKGALLAGFPHLHWFGGGQEDSGFAESFAEGFAQGFARACIAHRQSKEATS